MVAEVEVFVISLPVTVLAWNFNYIYSWNTCYSCAGKQMYTYEIMLSLLRKLLDIPSYIFLNKMFSLRTLIKCLLCKTILYKVYHTPPYS